MQFRPTIEGLEPRELPAARFLPIAAIVHTAKPALVYVQPGPDAVWSDISGANPNPGGIVGSIVPPGTPGVPATGVRPWTVWFEVTVDANGNRVDAGPMPTTPPPAGTYWGHVQLTGVYMQWAKAKDGSVWLRNVADVSADWTLLAIHTSVPVGGAVAGNGPPLGRGHHLPIHVPI